MVELETWPSSPPMGWGAAPPAGGWGARGRMEAVGMERREEGGVPDPPGLGEQILMNKRETNS